MGLAEIVLIVTMICAGYKETGNPLAVLEIFGTPILLELEKSKRRDMRRDNPGIENHRPSMRVIHDPSGKIVKHTMEECRQLENECIYLHGEEKFRFLDSHKRFPDCECKW